MELVFCYNAKKGIINGVIDLLHKTISPRTYECNLCAITYTYKKKKIWKDFIENFHIKISFIYAKQLGKLNLEIYKNDLPCCFLKKDDKYSIIINHKEINHFTNENELIAAIKKLRL